MTKVSKAFVVAAAAAVALTLAACSGSPSGNPSSNAAAWDGKQIPKAVISLAAQTTSFDPTASVSATDRAVSALMNSGLYNSSLTGEIVPGLAKDIKFSADFTSATVTLRDAEFSDGSKVTANDVKATIDREIGVPTSTIASSTRQVASITAVDDTTVKFDFKSPYPSFEAGAGSLAIYPASAMADPATYFKAPTVTSGQYTITTGWASNKLSLTPNPKYFGGEPAVKDLTVTVIADGNSAISQLQSGQIDFAGDLAPNYASQVAKISGLRVESSSVWGFYDLRLQNTKGPFSDPNVRKAANLTIDRAAIVKAIWGSYNTPQAGFWPKGMDGNANVSIKTDIPAAKKLLKGTKCESGCDVTMIYSDQDFAFSQQLALMVQQQLAQIGIKVTLVSLDGATVVNRLFAADFDIAPGAMASNGNTPDQILTLALNGKGPLKAEFTGYDSDVMNGYIQEAITNSGDKRKQAAEEIEKQFSADQPLLTLAPWIRQSATKLPSGVFVLTGAVAAMASVK